MFEIWDVKNLPWLYILTTSLAAPFSLSSWFQEATSNNFTDVCHGEQPEQLLHVGHMQGFRLLFRTHLQALINVAHGLRLVAVKNSHWWFKCLWKMLCFFSACVVNCVCTLQILPYSRRRGVFAANVALMLDHFLWTRVPVLFYRNMKMCASLVTLTCLFFLLVKMYKAYKDMH